MNEQGRWLDALHREQRLHRNVMRRWNNGTISNDTLDMSYDALSRAYLDAAEYGPQRMRRLYYRLATKYQAAAQKVVSDLSAALAELAKVVDDQERAYHRAQASPQEFFIIGETRRERKKNDPRYNETAGARVAADKEVVFAARNVVRLWKEEKT